MAVRAHAGDLRAERLGDLHGEAADPAGRPDDEHPLTRRHPAVVAHRLQGRGSPTRGRPPPATAEVPPARAPPCPPGRPRTRRRSPPRRRTPRPRAVPPSRRRRPPRPGRRTPSRARGCFGARRPKASRAAYGLPAMRCQTPRSTPGRRHPHQHLAGARLGPGDLRRPQHVPPCPRTRPVRPRASSPSRRAVGRAVVMIPPPEVGLRCKAYAYNVSWSRGERHDAAEEDVAWHRPGTGRGRLSRERVLRAAVALADSGGLESLTMRRLGEELGRGGHVALQARGQQGRPARRHGRPGLRRDRAAPRRAPTGGRRCARGPSRHAPR